MSHALDMGTRPDGVRVAGGQAANDPTGLWMTTGGELIRALDITGADLAYMVRYWLANSDLTANDPRRELVRYIQHMRVVPGHNAGRVRLAHETELTVEEAIRSESP